MIEAIAVVLLSIASPDDRLIDSLRECREIADDRARLECFDEAFPPADGGVDGEGSSGTQPATGSGSVDADEGVDGEGSSETEPATASGSVHAGTLPVDGPTKAVAVVPAEGGKRTLFVRCDDAELSVTIDWGRYLSSEAPAVTVRIDSLPPSRAKWARSEDKNASWLRPLGGKKARQREIAAFVSELVAGQRLAAQVIPRGGTAVTAVFDLSGAKAALGTVLRACAG